MSAEISVIFALCVVQGDADLQCKSHVPSLRIFSKNIEPGETYGRGQWPQTLMSMMLYVSNGVKVRLLVVLPQSYEGIVCSGLRRELLGLKRLHWPRINTIFALVLRNQWRIDILSTHSCNYVKLCQLSTRSLTYDIGREKIDDADVTVSMLVCNDEKLHINHTLSPSNMIQYCHHKDIQGVENPSLFHVTAIPCLQPVEHEDTSCSRTIRNETKVGFHCNAVTTFMLSDGLPGHPYCSRAPSMQRLRMDIGTTCQTHRWACPCCNYNLSRQWLWIIND